ncbi:MAG TPA: sensor histidine kinase [Caulobacteraceae bacterium]|nr:sensor histidine kinase [Caulobacteraceae bacterium]
MKRRELTSQTMDERVAALEAAVEARTRDLKAALDQRTALLHELDHRVKNNLQLISSLMLMQARRTADPSVRAALDGMLERLHAIATVHRRLFQTEDVERFDLSEFVRDLVADLAGSNRHPLLTFQCVLAPAEVPASRAASLALLINELVSNAMRHAFPDGRPGRILIDVRKSGEGLRIEIADDGVGMAGSPGGAQDAAAGFGLTIVDLLGRQLRACIRRETTDIGVRTVIALPPESVGVGR